MKCILEGQLQDIGVKSFNGRTDMVIPQDGDYNADQVSAANKDLSNLSNYQQALKNIGGRSNRNLWDNGYFVGGGSQNRSGKFPINQKCKVKYDQADGNCIDRNYKSSNTIVELLQDCIKVTLKADEAPNRFAHITSEELIVGETYTISILIKSISSVANIFVQENGGEFITPVHNTISTKGLFSATFTCTKSAQYQVIISNESKLEISIEIIAGKLEFGERQTLAYQKNENWYLLEIPDFQKTLEQCLRYYYDSGANTYGEEGSIKTEIWDAPGTSDSIHYTEGTRFPVRMRAIPAITFYSVVHHTPNKIAYGSNGEDALATPQALFVGTDGFAQINLIGEDPGFNGNQAYYFYIANAEL